MPARSFALSKKLFVFAAAISAFMIAAALGAGLVARGMIADHLRGGMPDDAIILSAGGISLGPLSLGASAVPLELKSELEVDPDVQSVHVEESLIIPARVFGTFFGHSYGTDVAVVGLDRESLAWVAPGSRSEWTVAEFVPVIVPKIFLEAYNASFAPSQGLPKLSESAFLNRTFTLEAGASSLGSSPRGSQPFPARIVAFTPRRDVMGVIVPLEFVRDVNVRFGSGGVARRLIVFARGPAEAERVVEKIRAKGYDAAAPSERLRNLRRVDLVAGVLITSAIALISTLALISSLFGATAWILERRDEAELYHQLGFARSEIVRRFIGEIAKPSCAGAAAGAILAGVAFSSLWAMLAGIIVPTAAVVVGVAAGARRVIPVWSAR